MTNLQELDQQKADTREIIDALIADGSDPDALYEIEHHFSGDRIEDVEPAMLAAFKLGYEVYEAEEMEMEDGTPVVCFDIVIEMALNEDRINEQAEQLMKLADEHNIYYDGWGTYFAGDEDDEDAEYEDEEE